MTTPYMMNDKTHSLVTELATILSSGESAFCFQGTLDSIQNVFISLISKSLPSID